MYKKGGRELGKLYLKRKSNERWRAEEEEEKEGEGKYILYVVVSTKIAGSVRQSVLN